MSRLLIKFFYWSFTLEILFAAGRRFEQSFREISSPNRDLDKAQYR